MIEGRKRFCGSDHVGPSGRTSHAAGPTPRMVADKDRPVGEEPVRRVALQSVATVRADSCDDSRRNAFSRHRDAIQNIPASPPARSRSAAALLTRSFTAFCPARLPSRTPQASWRPLRCARTSSANVPAPCRLRSNTRRSQAQAQEHVLAAPA